MSDPHLATADSDYESVEEEIEVKADPGKKDLSGDKVLAELAMMLKNIVEVQNGQASVRLVETKNPWELRNPFELKNWLHQISKWLENFIDLNENVPTHRILRFAASKIAESIRLNNEKLETMARDWKRAIQGDWLYEDLIDLIESDVTKAIAEEIHMKAEIRRRCIL